MFKQFFQTNVCWKAKSVSRGDFDQLKFASYENIILT